MKSGKYLHLTSEFTYVIFKPQNWKIQYEIINRSNSKLLFYVDLCNHSVNTEHQLCDVCEKQAHYSLMRNRNK